MSPQAVAKVIGLGFEVMVQAGAGAKASYPDSAYTEVGATLAEGARAVWDQADIVCKVRPPEDHPELGVHEAELAREGQLLVSLLWPVQNQELLDRLGARGCSAIAMDAVPRISRAQKMDVLSSMANIAGYRAVIEAANVFGSFFTGQFTAAGRVPPAKVLVIGAGVAGLAAIAAAKGLGAIVRAFDTRAAVKDQVKSLGGEFLELQFEERGEGAGGYAKVMSKEFIDAEMALFREQAREVDIVITTALIPGKPAPKLWTADMVEAMKPGSVVVDLAAEQGGNCDLTRPGEVAVEHGVHIIGYSDLPSRMANVSSDLYGTNLYHLLDEMGGAEGFRIDHDNEAVRGALVLENGESRWPPPQKPPVEDTRPPKVAPQPSLADDHSAGKRSDVALEKQVGTPEKAVPKSAWAPVMAILTVVFAGAWLGLRFGLAGETLDASTGEFLQHLTVFVLSCFVGWQVIWAVTPALHTPLMAVTNAISGIIIVGGMMQLRGDEITSSLVIGGIATLFAAINVAGGFFVTQRMLKMFRK
jgi:H+-translocating NAD(P) transhydrogenase subunit alpha